MGNAPHAGWTRAEYHDSKHGGRLFPTYTLYRIRSDAVGAARDLRNDPTVLRVTVRTTQSGYLLSAFRPAEPPPPGTPF